MSLKIAYIIPGLKYSGGIIHVLEEAREMKNKGHSITIFSPYADLNKFLYYSGLSKYFRFIKGICPDISYLPSKWRPVELINSLASIREMARVLSQSLDRDTDIVIADWYWTIFGASLSRKMGGRFKIVLKVQNPPQKEIDRACGWLFSFLCRRAVAQADAITTVSNGAGLAIRDYFNREAVNIGNGVREIFFKNIEASKKTELLKKLDINERRVLLYAGGLNRQKGIEILLRVMARLKKYNIILLIAGNGGRNYYEKAARHMGLGEYIRWLGQISPDELPLIYKLAHVFIFPSWFEGFGLPPLEAMACGVPVVLTDTEGAREYAKPGVNCIMAKPGEIDSLAKAVISILEDIGKAKKLGENGIETAKAFPWENVADRAEALYNKLVGR